MVHKANLSGEVEVRTRESVMAMWRAFKVVPDNAVVQSEEMLRMFSGLFVAVIRRKKKKKQKNMRDNLHACTILSDKHAMEPCFNSYFDAMDFNNNGQISKEEYGILFDCVGIGRDRLDVAFEALDADRDGLISRSEFVAAGLEYCYGLDETSKTQFMFGGLIF